MTFELERTGSNTATLIIGSTRVYFSYRVPVVFVGKTTGHKPICRGNEWGSTTAKHIGAALLAEGMEDRVARRNLPRLSADDFKAAIMAELADLG